MKQDFQKKLDDKIKNALKRGVVTALQVQVTCQGKIFFKKKYGQPYKYFDLASVTKCVCTVPLIIDLVSKHKLKLSDRVQDYLIFFKKTSVGKLKIKELLDQTSGLEWWRPYYKELLKKDKFQRDLYLKKIFLKEKPIKKKKCVYSDLNYILLGWIIESLHNRKLDFIFNSKIKRKLKLKDTFFIQNFLEKPKKKYFAPTEKTRERGIVQGFVHDDNCWSLGGISGHAGLFSTLEETSKLAESLLSQYNKPSSILKKFAKRAVPKARGDWSLGFMIPSRPTSTGGSFISEKSFGFPGFTGTSVWIDTERNATVTILSNRTFPRRTEKRFAPLRREIHDLIWEALDEKK